MKYILTLFGFAVMSISLAQLPNYVPSDELVGWWGFENSLLDASSNGLDLQNQGCSFQEGRNGYETSALTCEGDASMAWTFMPPVEGAFSVSIWCKMNTLFDYGAYSWIEYGQSLIGSSGSSGWNLGIDSANLYVYYFYASQNAGGCPGIGDDISGSSATEWFHLVGVRDESSTRLYFNGTLVMTSECASGASMNYINNELRFANRDNASPGAIRSVDDAGIWNRALDEDEILALYLSEQPISGCTDSTACNFNPEAEVEDGSCLFPPQMDLGIDTVTCEDVVVLDAGEGFVSYQWNTGENTQSIEAMISGEYVVTVVGAANSSNAFAMNFDGDNDLIQTDIPASELLGLDGLSIAVRFKWMGEDSDGGPQEQGILSNARSGNSQLDFGIDFEWPEGDRRLSLAWADMSTLGSNGMQYSSLDAVAIEPGVWYDVVVTLSTNSVKWYLDGELVEQDLVVFSELGQESDEVPSLRLGKANEIYDTHFNGVLDDLQFFTRNLTFEEAEGVFSCDANLDATGLIGHWTFDEGSGVEALDASPQGNDGNVLGAQFIPAPPASVCSGCAVSDTIQVTLHHGGCFCGQGTIWDETTEQCIAIDNDPLPACGDGTVWDPVEEECIIVMPSDTDFDGCVSMVDLLGLLTVFGSCIEVPWECGDPLEYQGYDYETVQIGEQCWLAENLRNEKYSNGEPIVSSLTAPQWTVTNDGAWAVYGEGNTYCVHVSPDGDACDEAWSKEEFGLLYNWYAVDDCRGLCPSGWHVPNDGEWMTLVQQFGGMSEAGEALKATYSWQNEGNGTDSSGFTGLAAGVRASSDGEFRLAGDYGYWWSSSSAGGQATYWRLRSDDNQVYQAPDQRDGFSIRCMQNQD